MCILYNRVAPKMISLHATLPPLVPIEPFTISSLVEEYGDDLQTEKIGTIYNRKWILDRDWESIVKTENGIIHRSAKRGWIFDLGSIPSILESFQKRDDRKALMAFINHDIDFGINSFPSNICNDYLYQTVKLAGGSDWHAWRIWRFIADNYYHKTPERLLYEKRWAKCEFIEK